MTPEETELHDKRQSAVHEAGHAVVAFFLGYMPMAWLESSGTDDPMNDKTWVGHTSNTVGDMKKCGKYIGIAGVVSERFDTDKTITANEIFEEWREYGLEDLSNADLTLIPDDWDERLDGIKGALATITQQAKVLQEVANELVKNQRVSRERMAMLVALHQKK